MNKKRLLALVGIFGMVLVGCGNKTNTSSSSSKTEGSSSSSQDGSSSSSSSQSGSSSKGSSSTSSSSSSSSSGGSKEVSFYGTIRFYYHDNDASYSNIALWVWENGGAGALYSFNEYDGKDDVGVYCDVNMKAVKMSGAIKGVNFILRNPKNWDGQSNDTYADFSKFSSTIETIDSGERITVYFSKGQGSSLYTFGTKEEALGDYVKSATFSNWTTVHVIGAGTSKERDEKDVGLVSEYKLYAFPASYYAIPEDTRDSAKSSYLVKTGNPNSNSFDITLDSSADLSFGYTIECAFPRNAINYTPVNLGATGLFDTDEFVTKYCYSGDDLGLTWNEEGTVPTFKLWAPTSNAVNLRLYKKGTPSALKQIANVQYDYYLEKPMVRGEHGVWSYSVSDFDTRYHFYTYSIINSLGTVETIDPYAKGSGVNGVRGAIINEAAWDSTDPTNFVSDLEGLTAIDSPSDLTVYETHIRDFTSDSSWVSNKGNRPGTYNAFVEEGTTYTKDGVTVTTGFDSLKELNVNAVQLLPVFDQDNDERVWLEDDNLTYSKLPEYNWGYNPQNYDVVEGAYSSDPETPLIRIKEYKNMIDVLAKNDMRTIMDVVYNHTSTISNNAFGKTVPEYYFMIDSSGNYIDETGVHNTLNTYRTMMSKYVVDSCVFWAKEYGVKGFRFDLMGCLSTATIRAVKDALYAIDPEIVVYGEGWRGSGTSDSGQAGTYQVYKDLGDNGKGSVGAFNDSGRDGLKGNTSYGSVAPSYGFMSQGEADLSDDTMYNAACTYLGENRNMTLNGLATPSYQTVNYVSCHDNYTLYDQLNYCYNAGQGASGDSNPGVADTTLATTAFVLNSQGIAFIQGGEELLRQKIMTSDNPYWDKIESNDYVSLSDGTRLIRNSYAYGDAVNSYKWDRKITFNSYFKKYAEATTTRKELVASGVLGADYSTVIQGTYIKDGTSTKVTRLWDDMVDTSSGSHRAILAAQSEWSKIDATKKDVYVFLGGRMSGNSSSIGCGSGTLKVLYSTVREKGSTITVSDDSFQIGKYEMLIAERIA